MRLLRLTHEHRHDGDSRSGRREPFTVGDAIAERVPRPSTTLCSTRLDSTAADDGASVPRSKLADTAIGNYDFVAATRRRVAATASGFETSGFERGAASIAYFRSASGGKLRFVGPV